jgi:uncharacterized protein
MLILLSPAKSLDMQRKLKTQESTLPAFDKQTNELIAILKKKSVSEIKTLMSLSDKLAALNHERYQDFSAKYSSDNATQALAAFNGDVYDGLDAASLSAKDLQYAQAHLRILSGLYGLLRPLDLMQPYRLEMGTKLPSKKGEDLYDFWGNSLAHAINEAAQAAGSSHVINLASNEYFKAAQTKAIERPIITPQFKEHKDGQLKIISFYAKKARGTMARWIIQNHVTKADKLKDFAEDGYRFETENAKKGELLFVRG